MKDSGLPEAATAAAFARQNDLALLIHQSFQPRLGSNGKYAYFRKDDGSRVTWDRSEYVVAQRDIIKILRPKAPKPTKPKLPDTPKQARIPKCSLFPLSRDDRAVARYRGGLRSAECTESDFCRTR